MSDTLAPRSRGAFALAAAALVAAACIASTTQAQTPVVRTAFPEARGIPLTAFPRFVKLSDRAYGYEEIRQPGMTTVSLVVIGTNGVLVADGQGSTAATQTMVNKIKELTPLPIKWYVVGSDHGDHTAGNSVLAKDIRYIVSPASLAQLKKDSAAATQGRVVVVPTVAMTSNEETIDLGGVTVKVLSLGRAHTGGDLMVQLPREKILFMSEAFLNRVFPAMRSAYPSEWVKTVDAALALKGVDQYIPGHGFIEAPKVSREELVTFRDALVSVIAEAKRQKALGVSVDDAIKQANWGSLSSWMLADQQGAIAMRRVWMELDGQLK